MCNYSSNRTVLRLPRFTLVLFFLTGLVNLSETLASEDLTGEAAHSAGRTDSLTLTPALQARSGLHAEQLKITTQHPEIIRYGRTLAKSALLRFQSDFLHQQARLKKAYAQKQLAKTQHSRLKANAENTQWRAEKIALQTLKSHAVEQWGQKIVHTLTTDQPAQGFLTAPSTALVAIDTPLDDRYRMPAMITLALDSNRRHTATATLLDPVPATAFPSPGKRFFYYTQDPAFLPNQPLIAWLPLTQQPLTGVIVPDSAIIHHLDQQFIYLKTGDATFKRQHISLSHPVSGGLLIVEKNIYQTPIVTRGAQMLFSEEFKTTIPEEDDDD